MNKIAFFVSLILILGLAAVLVAKFIHSSSGRVIGPAKGPALPGAPVGPANGGPTVMPQADSDPPPPMDASSPQPEGRPYLQLPLSFPKITDLKFKGFRERSGGAVHDPLINTVLELCRARTGRAPNENSSGD